MTFETYLWTTFGAFLTLAIFSFLYKDNPFYKFAEHLFVGVSAGYFVIILWHNGLEPNLFGRLQDGDWYLLWLNSERPWYLVPAILGIMMWTRFSRKYSWISRWPLGLYIGIATGVSIPLYMANSVLKQAVASMAPLNLSNFFGQGLLDIGSGYSQLIMFVGAVAALLYFFFSKAHTGLLGVTAKFGIWILMLGFGASFGYTVLARISLLINRLQYLFGNWMGAAFNEKNKNYQLGFPFIFWTVVALILIYAATEIYRTRREPEKKVENIS